MDLSKLNTWISLSANLGVLIGIVFLSIEIGQSNRIAERDGRSELVTQDIEFQNLIIDSPELTNLMVKLSDPNAELTPQDRVRAISLSRMLIDRAANLNINYESDLLSGEPLERQFGAIISIMRRVPGINPILEEELAPRGLTLFIDRMWDEIERPR